MSALSELTLPEGFTARPLPLDVGDSPVLAVGLCLLPKKLLALPDIPSRSYLFRWETFSEYARFYGLISSTGKGPLRVQFSVDAEICVDEEVDLVIGNRIFCFACPAVVHRFSTVRCLFSHPEIETMLAPIVMCRDLFGTLGHAPDCALGIATGAAGVVCKHGFDVCPKCDPCTCGPQSTETSERSK